ncbi:branched-chain amino acid ABC transporter permease [Xanthobacter tagetidis]|jgi:branched-chain amino acid transport system permease protein|uniref:Branched-chain amino acid ABC transporter permease n=1 Tax=Xanthobacter tagetidis TaxID=60216 RepID=A0A3L7A1V3_9HYPH|nr:branched-chain amino acid ABC transporter permease [Xanthobacter tagetidis]MBB6307158.1 branched-chain amino acid transport system permease protein [Xanthobacter tagetidis]RLP74000.1 branched-chain amino acid ABC transporter permease [Xanthobacter tagetidis]
MTTELLQFTFSGLTVGAVYASVALGFTLIYNASHVVNLAQGEFVMLGAMSTVFLAAAGLPLPVAMILAVLISMVAGLALHRFAIAPARGADPIALIIITIGASIFLRGLAQIVFDKRFHSLPPWFGAEPIVIGGAAVLPQSLVVLAGMLVVLVGLWLFMTRTLFGRAILAASNNPMAATLVGINVPVIVAATFLISSLLGAVVGILVTPITLTSYDAGTILALKGFAAVMLGGIGNPPGAVLGGLLLGLAESFGAGLISSQYKDAIAFVILLAVLLLRPRGLLGGAALERV